jgi:ABC-type amino acid transport system permease subunit
MTQTSSRFTLGFGYAAAITIVASAVLTMAKEKHEPLLLWMKAVTMHHWITHAVAVLALFALLGFVLSMRGADSNRELEFPPLAAALVAATLIGGAFIGGLYLIMAMQ